MEYSDLLEVYVTDNIFENFYTKQIYERVDELLKTKDIQVQKIVKMRVEGISYSEISDRIGISENSARVIDFRTKKWLKDMLKKEGLT